MLIASATTLPLLLGAAGCRSAELFAGPDPLAGRPRLSHDVLMLEAAVATEENLISAYKSVISTLTGSAGAARARDLQPLLAQHELHLLQLRARLIVPAGGQASPGPSAAASARAARTVPGSIAGLRAAEQQSAALGVQRLATVEPTLAQLFASIAASEVTHVRALSVLGA
jgi:hypothetical protein